MSKLDVVHWVPRMPMFDRVHKHIGGAVQEEAELVCRESMAGGPVGVQEVL